MSDVLGLTINRMVEIAHRNALEKGFYDKSGGPEDDNVGEKLMLMVTELAEAFEEVRNGRRPNELYYDPSNPGKPEGVPAELADVVIRIADFCGRHRIDLEHAITVKMAYNSRRPYKHGKTC